jgi:hypothetical protein
VKLLLRKLNLLSPIQGAIQNGVSTAEPWQIDLGLGVNFFAVGRCNAYQVDTYFEPADVKG